MDSLSAYSVDIGPAGETCGLMSFVKSCLAKYHEKFHASITHPLTNELCAGTLPDYKLFVYLVQDLKYFQLGLNLFGNALVHCDELKSAIVLGKQIGFLSNDENDYFHRCLAQLRTEASGEILDHVSSMVTDPPTLPVVHTYLEALSYLTYDSRSYAEIITSMYVMEKAYLGWAEPHYEKIQNLAYKHSEWIVLHSGPGFSAWVDFLESEVNRVAEHDSAACEQFFVKTLELEIAFFEACYTYEDAQAVA